MEFHYSETLCNTQFLEYNQIIIKITTITIKDKPMLLSVNLLFAFLVLLIGFLMLLVKG